jgi:hydroxyacyl-ACP dehydratase HTD2-like protein with hotdog domain
MSDLIDLETYRERLGTTETVDMGTIARREVRRYARAVEDDNPLFWDVSHARNEGYDDLVVPPNMPPSILETDAGTPAGDLREDGLPPSLGVEPEFPKGVRTMKGERRLRFHRYATAGDRFVRDSTFDDIYQKRGSELGTLTFTVTVEEYSVDGTPVVTNTQTHLHYDSE